MLTEKLTSFITEYEDLEKQMSSPEVTSDPSQMKVLGKKLSSLREIVELGREYLEKQKNIEELTKLQTDADLEVAEMAKAELTEEMLSLQDLEEKVKIALIPKDPHDHKDVIIEVRPAAGGEESSLFAAEYARALFRYAEENRYNVELLSKQDSESGGVKEMIFAVRGEGAFAALKFESGVHRVQRIPKTESQGRVHTSTITVIVLPEIEEIEFEIAPADVRVDVFRSSGPGGQSVNTTDSAVRLTHVPTRIIVTCQDEKSQHKNKEKAFKVLRSRLYAIEEEKRQKEAGAERLAQIGTGDRSEKIRTYNFPQDRVTDHRIGKNFSNLPSIMEGNLNALIESLQEAERLKRLQSSGL